MLQQTLITPSTGNTCMNIDSSGGTLMTSYIQYLKKGNMSDLVTPEEFN